MKEEAIKSAGTTARNCGYDLPLSVIRAIVRTYEQALWRPIEEAPRNGKPFLGYSEKKGLFAVCYMENISTELPLYVCRPINWDWDYEEPPVFNHYRPLPPPPGKEG